MIELDLFSNALETKVDLKFHVYEAEEAEASWR